MPIAVTRGHQIPNYRVPNAGRRTSAQDVIAMLQYADLWRGAGTLHDDGTMRVDMQGMIPAAGAVPAQQNIQVQINGINGNSTVAHANVSHGIVTDDIPNQRGAVRKVIQALNKSLDDAHSYTVTGTSP